MVTVSELMASNTGPARSMTAGSPPTMHTRSPLAAAAGPPVTPQSSTATPSAVGLGPDGLHARGRDGADDDEDGVGAGRGQPAVGPGQHGVDLLVVDHGHHHHVGTTDQVRRRWPPPGPGPGTVRWPRDARRTPPGGGPARRTLVATPSPMAPSPMTPTVGPVSGRTGLGWLVVRHWRPPVGRCGLAACRCWVRR